MGLLDDLRNQADTQRVSEEEEAGREANREQYYLDKIQPRMLKTYQFFKELVEHLNYIKMGTIVEYPLMPGGAPLPLCQQGYKVVIDSSKALKRIDFSMEGVLEEPVEFEICGKDAVFNHSERIRSYAFRHDYKDRKDAAQYVQSANFTLKGPLPLKVTVEAVIDTSEIRLTVRNFVEPGFTKHVMTVDDFSDEFLDRIGKFVLRKEATLFGNTEELTEEARKQIRDRMIVEQRIREQELREAEEREKAEAQVEKEKSSKEQIKRAVNAKVGKKKEKLKDMFNKLKKQAGFGSATTETTMPPAPAAAKPQTPTRQAPAQPASAAPKQQMPEPPAPVVPASVPISAKPAAVAKPPATKAHVPLAMVEADKQTAVPPVEEPTPQAPEPPVAKKSPPPRVYIAPTPNPFLTPEQLEALPDPEKLNKQIKDSSEDKPDSESAAAPASSANPVLTPEELERDLANIMERNTLENPALKIPEKESDPAPLAETSSSNPFLTVEVPDIDPSATPSQVKIPSAEKSSPASAASEAPISSPILKSTAHNAGAPLSSKSPQVDKKSKDKS